MGAADRLGTLAGGPRRQRTPDSAPAGAGLGAGEVDAYVASCHVEMGPMTSMDMRCPAECKSRRGTHTLALTGQRGAAVCVSATFAGAGVYGSGVSGVLRGGVGAVAQCAQSLRKDA